MSRVEENQKMRDRLGRIHLTSGDMAMLASVLTDISQSLAVIADTQLEYLHSETEPPILFKDGEAFFMGPKRGKLMEKTLDDFINHIFPPVEDKPGYIWINKRNHEIAKRDLVKEQIERVYEQYHILQEKLKSNNTKEPHIPLCKGLQADMVIIDEFLTEKEETDGN